MKSRDANSTLEVTENEKDSHGTGALVRRLKTKLVFLMLVLIIIMYVMFNVKRNNLHLEFNQANILSRYYPNLHLISNTTNNGSGNNGTKSKKENGNGNSKNDDNEKVKKKKESESAKTVSQDLTATSHILHDQTITLSTTLRDTDKNNEKTISQQGTQGTLILGNKTTNASENITVIRMSTQYYLCPTFMGRLGNSMFIFASSYALAKDNGLKLVITENDNIYKSLELTMDVMNESDRNSICNAAFTLRYPKSATFENTTVPKHKNIKVVGFLQSWKYFKKWEDEIGEQFVFRKEIQENAKNVRQAVLNKLKSSTDKNITTVGVHIRRGDYTIDRRETASVTYLRNARNYFRKRFNNVRFLVSTNPDETSRSWCMENFVDENNDTILITPNSPEVDMLFLSQCDHTIITVGSFSWWVGWLNRGITTAYYDIINRYNIDRYVVSDHIYPGWIKIKS